MIFLLAGILTIGAFLVISGSAGNKAKLTASEISLLAYNAGFSGDDLITAVAIALAESGGQTGAYNPEITANTPLGQGSVGLWQIYQKAHPEFTGMDLHDPQVNANAAYSVYRQAGFSFHPWSTFKNNAYLTYLNDASGAVNA
jgi:hypothetical protein